MLGSKTISFREQSREHQANDSNSRLMPLVKKKTNPKLSSATTAIKNHLQTHQSLMSCFARGRKTITRTPKQTTGISEMLDSANGCAAAPDAALDPNRANFVTRKCTGISLFVHFGGNLIPF